MAGTAQLDDLRTAWFKYEVQKKMFEAGFVNNGELWFDKSSARVFVDTAMEGNFKEKSTFEVTGEK